MSPIVKVVVDTGKPDTVEFQFMAGHDIKEHSVITYDKMNGVQFKVVSISPDDWVTCSIVDSDIYKLKLHYFQMNTMMFTVYRQGGEYSDNDRSHLSVPEDDGISGRVEFL